MCWPSLLPRPGCSAISNNANASDAHGADSITGTDRSSIGRGALFAHPADSPARLREDEYSIESRLDVPPEIKKGSYDVHCEVRVLASGRPFGVNCYAMDPNVPRKLVEAVGAASARSLFVPAIRDGKPTQIFMLLMARIMVTKSEPLSWYR